MGMNLHIPDEQSHNHDQSLTASPSFSHELDQDRWVENHSDCLFRYALGQVRNASVAEDLVQETFLAALRGRDRFSGRSSERTWLVGILRHKIIDHLRASRRVTPLATVSDSRDSESEDSFLLWMHEAAADCMTPQRRLELSEFRAALEEALGALPPRMAQVFQMYEMEERSGQEVCEQMAISPSNLWVMLHRARHELRNELSDWLTEGALAASGISAQASV